MFQVIFNELSAAEMSQLPKDLQLELLMDFQVMPEDLENLDAAATERPGGGGGFGVIKRDGQTLYRYRTTDYRIYFAPHEQGVLVHRVLHKNTIRDFLYRTNLPVDEDVQVSESNGFWELIEEGIRSRQVK